MGIAHQAGQGAQVVSLDGRAGSQDNRRCAVIETRRVAGGHRAALLECGPHARQLIQRSVGPYMFIDFEQLSAFAGLDRDRHDLAEEVPIGDRARGAQLALQRQRILGFTAYAMALGDVLRRNAHMDAVERVVQDAEHIVDGLQVAEAAPPTSAGQQIGSTAHGFGTAANGHLGLPQQQRLRRGDDRLQAGTAQAIDVERRGFLGNAGVHGGYPGEIGVLGFGRDDVAHHHMTDALGSAPTALESGVNRSRGQLG
ncbi:hypothetical protein D9M70_394020 [compost metagenome]